MKTGKDTIGFLLNDAARLMRKDFERRTRSLGLTRAQWQALFHLARNEGCNQATLADLLEVEPITLARLVDRLETERPGRAPSPIRPTAARGCCSWASGRIRCWSSCERWAPRRGRSRSPASARMSARC